MATIEDTPRPRWQNYERRHCTQFTIHSIYIIRSYIQTLETGVVHLRFCSSFDWYQFLSSHFFYYSFLFYLAVFLIFALKINDGKKMTMENVEIVCLFHCTVKCFDSKYRFLVYGRHTSFELSVGWIRFV